MMFTSFLGFFGSVALVLAGLALSHAGGAFLNLHGLVVVLGGTLSAVVFHSEGGHLFGAFKGFFKAFWGQRCPPPARLIPELTGIAERAKGSTPAAALATTDGGLGDGFMATAAQIALQNLNEPEVVRALLLRSVHSRRQEANEIVNVYRVAGIMSPMFGLIGTLIGIIDVLRNITNPESVGVAMSTAITSAFYGIGLANMVCVPLAGKLRGLMNREVECKTLIAEGVADIVKGEFPLVVEHRLWTLVDGSSPAAR